MFLKYGINQHNELIHIDYAPRGKTTLLCPYCGGDLLAKKGDVNIHHFAHEGKTCKAANRPDDHLALPAFDRFDLHLSSKDYATLQQFYFEPDSLNKRQIKRLGDLGLAYRSKFAEGYYLTYKGKVPFGDLPLAQFDKFQTPLIEARHSELERDALLAEAYSSGDLAIKRADVRIYRAQWQRVLSMRLYFLQVETPAVADLYKIGVTSRPIEARLHEIEADLMPRIGSVRLHVIGLWEHYGNLEWYFKFRYHAYQRPIGLLTEYFAFEEIKPVLNDLQALPEKELSPMEQAILVGKPPELGQV